MTGRRIPGRGRGLARQRQGLEQVPISRESSKRRAAFYVGLRGRGPGDQALGPGVEAEAQQGTALGQGP